jgi:hypothetical protein
VWQANTGELSKEPRKPTVPENNRRPTQPDEITGVLEPKQVTVEDIDSYKASIEDNRTGDNSHE